MIVAERKPLPELLEMLSDVERLLILGCRGCVAVCSAGGDKEVSVLAGALRLGRKLRGRATEIDEDTYIRQCDPEYLEPLKERGRAYDVVLSMACGVGVNFVADVCPGVRVLQTVRVVDLWADAARSIPVCPAFGNRSTTSFQNSTGPRASRRSCPFATGPLLGTVGLVAELGRICSRDRRKQSGTGPDLRRVRCDRRAWSSEEW
jgi:ferredoxin